MRHLLDLDCCQVEQGWSRDPCPEARIMSGISGQALPLVGWSHALGSGGPFLGTLAVVVWSVPSCMLRSLELVQTVVDLALCLSRSWCPVPGLGLGPGGLSFTRRWPRQENPEHLGGECPGQGRDLPLLPHLSSLSASTLEAQLLLIFVVHVSQWIYLPHLHKKYHTPMLGAGPSGSADSSKAESLAG